MKLGLGTVQFGLKYGVSNTSGQTSAAEVAEILDSACKAGISVLDTAAAYGQSEEVLGTTLRGDEGFDIVTKIPPVERGASVSVSEHFSASLLRLKRSSVYGALFHRASDLLGPDGDELYRGLSDEQQRGRVQKIGVSVYPEDDVKTLLSRYDIQLIQMPINLLDQRLVRSGVVEECAAKSIEIHVRSVFLQGLLLMELPAVSSFFDPVRPVLSCFHEVCLGAGVSPVEGALSFIRTVYQAGTILVGVNSHDQLKSTCASWLRSSEFACPFDVDFFSLNQSEYLNPSNWRLS